MGYTKTNWANGDVITAEKMNNLESGVEALATQSPPDWNQNDPNEDGYIANRPFYIAGETNTEIVNNAFSFNNSNQSAPIPLDTENILEILKNGTEFTAYYDGTYYSGEIINKDTYYLIGNCSIGPEEIASEDNIDMPFLLGVMAYNTPDSSGVLGVLILKDSYTGEKNISISIKTLDVHKIDSKYLPDSKFDLSDRMTKGVDSNGAEVDGAIVEGSLNNTASGYASHAEGLQTVASGARSHAEGYRTTASDYTSHAEGDGTTASGYISHAEGLSTTASGQASHAEGSTTTASGDFSHAEGGATKALGEHSHAEGFNTIAKHQSQHVFGEFNIEDPSSNASDLKGTYVEIVGKGISDRSRSNARTLDWQGNERLAGSLTLGDGTNDVVTISAVQLKNLLTPLMVEKTIETDTDSGNVTTVLNMAWQQIHDAFVSGRNVLIFLENYVSDLSDYVLVSHIGFSDNKYIVEDTSGVRYKCDTTSGYPSVELTN